MIENTQEQVRRKPIELTAATPREEFRSMDQDSFPNDDTYREDLAESRTPVASPTIVTTTGQIVGPLFPDNELNDLRRKWDKVQTGFVDEPRTAVEQADRLVAAVVNRITDQFAAERTELERQWDRGDAVSTEDLRQALRRYRWFFDRLLAF
jgi:hypothetical protein